LRTVTAALCCPANCIVPQLDGTAADALFDEAAPAHKE
jgi:hypothetical protein